MPGVNEIAIMKCAQAGGSEAIRNVIAHRAHQRPDPVMLVLPDEDTAKRMMKTRIHPLLSDTPPLRELRTEAAKDRTNTTAMLANGFTLRIAWAGSAASLASDPVATVVLDEVDKYKAFTGNDGSPIDLARVRTRTYEGRYLVVALSTPTTTEGYIHQLHAASDAKLRYWMPCPRCGKRFVVGLGHLRIPQHEPGKEHESAAAVEKNRSAWLECPHCAERIDEEDRPAMIRSGAWACDSAAGSADFEMLCREAGGGGIVLEGLQGASRLGFHLPIFLCLWTPLHKIASEDLRSRGTAPKRLAFITSWLAEPWTESQIEPDEVEFTSRAAAATAEPMVVPPWTCALLATADVQADRFYYVVRAWGYGYRSQLVSYGMVFTWSDLRRATLDAKFRVLGDTQRISPMYLGIDSNFEPQRVYGYAITDPARILCLKGENNPTSKAIYTVRATYRPPQSNRAEIRHLWYHRLDTGHFKDRLSAAMYASVPDIDQKTGEVLGEADQWALCRTGNSDRPADPEYVEHMTSEHKIGYRKSGRIEYRWEKVRAGVRNDWWDCEVYQWAMADIARLESLAPPSPKPPPAEASPPRPEPRPPGSLGRRPPEVRRSYRK